VVVNVGNRTSPALMGSCDLVGRVGGVALSGNHACVAEETAWDGTNYYGGGLVIIDCSDPTAPREIARHTAHGYLYDVAVSGHHAFVTGPETDLGVLDISDPTHPRTVGRYGTSGAGRTVAVSGTCAFLLRWDTGLTVLDITDPTAPRKIGANATLSECEAFCVSANGHVVAIGEEGLILLEMSPFFSRLARTAAGLDLSWEGFGRARLERATRLEEPDWMPIQGSEGADNATVPIGRGSEFFRVHRF